MFSERGMWYRFFTILKLEKNVIAGAWCHASMYMHKIH